MIDSPTAAREEVAGWLDGLKNFMPAIKLPLERNVTVGLSPAGQNETEFLVRISVYASAANDFVKAIENVEDYTNQVEDLLESDVPRSTWTTTYEPGLSSWHAYTVVSVGREDF